MKELIKLYGNKYMVKNSNNYIIEKDTNKCSHLSKGENGEDIKSNNIKETKRVKKCNTK